MRIVHTSDWHAGRLWKNVNRLPELGAILDNLADFLVRERVDLLLMSGDVFDSAGPSAEAERMVFTFFRRIGSAGVQSVVIAGNHDHPARLEAWGTLAELVGVRSVGLPRRRDDGGLIEIDSSDGERAQIVAVPFASVGRLVSAIEITADASVAAQKYAHGMQRILEHLAEGFRPDAIRLIVAHTHLANAQHRRARVEPAAQLLGTTSSLADAAAFVGARSGWEEREREESVAASEADELRAARRHAQELALAVRVEKTAELESVERHRVNIPREFLAVRSRIAQVVGVSTDAMPFAGELIEVRNTYEDWTGAIERLLRGFGLSLLVPEQLYRPAAQFVNSTLPPCQDK